MALAGRSRADENGPGSGPFTYQQWQSMAQTGESPAPPMPPRPPRAP